MRIDKGTVVFVTGGASGLGCATVRRLHGLGACVAIADMNEDAMKALCEELGGDNIIYMKCDVTSEDMVQECIKVTVEKWGRLDAAITCAGVANPVMTLTSKGALNMKTFDLVMKINLYGSTYVAKHAAVAMAKNTPNEQTGERGAIVFVSSVAGEEGQRGQVAYSASKGAINGMLLPMARDLGRFGIRVVAIAPGTFRTAMTDKMPQKVRDRLLADTPMGRFGQEHEFAHMACAIMENSYLNGVHLRLDGAVKMSNL